MALLIAKVFLPLLFGIFVWSKVGNPRNKCALEPGHSLMDWIRLGSSGKDLTGLGSKAGTLQVTLEELQTHKEKTDAWIAIRGRVYNVTHYLPFHPGGQSELMRGAGIDATKLFDQIHPWVNIDQILQKCYVGRLVSPSHNLDTSNLFSSPGKPSSPNTPTQSLLAANAKPSTNEVILVQQAEPAPPKHDWLQKTDSINLVFYTKPYMNPQVQVYPVESDANMLRVNLRYDGKTFVTRLRLEENIQWPGQVKVNYETGKVEIMFRKVVSKIWENCDFQDITQDNSQEVQSQTDYKVLRRTSPSHDTCLLELERCDGRKSTIPLGQHVRITAKIKGEEVSRSYTAVPNTLFTALKPHSPTSDSLSLMIKTYGPRGTMSTHMCSQQPGAIVQVSGPYGAFDIARLEPRETFVLLAAGSGITPMLGLLVFLLERRTRKSVHVSLVFFNKAEEDILFKEQFDALQKQDDRFSVQYVLSRPSTKWDGATGHVSTSLLRHIVEQNTGSSGYSSKDIFFMICGPAKFTASANSLLKTDLNVEESQIHEFLG